MSPIRYLIMSQGFRCHYILSSYCKNIVSFNRSFHSSQCSSANTQPNIQDDHEPVRKLYKDVVPKIGLEVHAQLNINSKLFSQGGNLSRASPNSQLDLFDISLPGTLPTLNRKALRAAISSSLGLNCTIQDMIHFDRKNYFYADMPAGFQLTQYNNPIAKDGFIEFIVTSYHKSVIAHSQQYDLVRCLYFEDRKDLDDFAPYMKRSHIKQIQLEQDSAKSLHQLENETHRELYNLVDYNRSGAALIEIVFEPDLTNHHEASSLIKELTYALKALGTCDCEFQEGSLRVDANVSIQSISDQNVDNSARVELKNLNSLKSLNKGIAQEINRQANLILAGGVVIQETRTYDTKSGLTVPLRLKEESVDYRYVPEPSIPPLRIDKEMIEEVKKDLPSSMPCDVKNDLIAEYNLDLVLVAEIIEEPGLGNYLVEIMRNRASYNANVVADFLIYTISNLKSIVGPPVKVNFDESSEFKQTLNAETMQTIFDMMLQDEISYATAYEVIKYIYVNNDKSNPRKIVNDFGWYQINDQTRIGELCADLIKKMRNISKKYARKGEKRHLRVILEKLCELTDNKINVKRAIESLNEQLKPPKASGM